MLLVTSSLMLTGCASSLGSNSPSTGVPVSTVVTQTKVVTQMVCPAELDQPAPAQPSVPADATVTANQSGANYVSSLIAWGQGVAKLFGDAQAACKTATAPAPAQPANGAP